MSRFDNICGMPGNPSFYGERYQDYSEKGLQELKDLNINTVFANLAWSRPWIDAVVLEHIVVSESFPLLSDANDVRKNRERFAGRIAMIKKMGMKAFGLFGIPRYFDFMAYPKEYEVLRGATVSTVEPGASVMCVKSPQVMLVYKELINDLLTNVPDLDGMLVYTYDELAEVCDEDSDCPRCKGIPVENRIPEFLNELYKYMNEIKNGFELWWEPWELSAAQTYRIMDSLNPEIGISCHTTINEVYFVNETDLWFRNVACKAREQDRKMIGELFMSSSGEELGVIAGYPCPRLVYNQLSSLARVPGVTGIKEYFGLVPGFFSVNERVMKEFTSFKDKSFNELIDDISGSYTTQCTELKEVWEYGSRTLEMIPWELSWVMRFSNYQPYDPSYWGKTRFVDLMKTPWSTPSWLSNRRSYYLVVDNEGNYTKTMQNDIVKRFEICIEYLDKALDIAKNVTVNEKHLDEFNRQKESLRLLKCYIICRKNHLQLSNISERIKKGTAKENDKNVISMLLTGELENAGNLMDILKGSSIPYMINTEIIEQTIKAIEVCKTELNTDISEWAGKYF